MQYNHTNISVELFSPTAQYLIFALTCQLEQVESLTIEEGDNIERKKIINATQRRQLEENLI